MPKTCAVCRHPGRVEIDSALLNGEPTRSVAEAFGLSEPTVKGHRRSAHHLRRSPLQRDTRQPHTAASLLARIEECRGDDEALRGLRLAVRMLPPEEKRVLVAALRSRAGRGKVAEPVEEAA